MRERRLEAVQTKGTSRIGNDPKKNYPVETQARPLIDVEEVENRSMVWVVSLVARLVILQVTLNGSVGLLSPFRQTFLWLTQ